MRDAFRRRPHDFRRRIIARIYTNRKDTFQKEEQFLQMIQKHEVGKRYYNTHLTTGHWSSDPDKFKEIVSKRDYHAVSDETREKMRNAKLGRKLSEETKRKVSENHSRHMKGKTHSDEAKRKISENNAAHKEDYVHPMQGKHHTDEAKQKMSESRKGVKQTQDTIDKRAEKLRGQKRSEEFCRAISERLKGKPLSEECKRKLSEVRKGRIPWNKGLKAETDERVAKNVENRMKNLKESRCST
jgi:hypothetical protein